MKKPYKRLDKRIITFDHGDDCKSVVLAKLGMSNKAIKARTSLSDNQISYRLAKAKAVEENAGGYRVEFRNGVSPLAQQLIDDLSGVLEKEIQRTIVPRILHPTPEIVKIAK
jgi:hypothetical protein